MFAIEKFFDLKSMCVYQLNQLNSTRTYILCKDKKQESKKQRCVYFHFGFISFCNVNNSKIASSCVECLRQSGKLLLFVKKIKQISPDSPEFILENREEVSLHLVCYSWRNNAKYCCANCDNRDTFGFPFWKKNKKSDTLLSTHLTHFKTIFKKLSIYCFLNGNLRHKAISHTHFTCHVFMSHMKNSKFFFSLYTQHMRIWIYKYLFEQQSFVRCEKFCVIISYDLSPFYRLSGNSARK